MEDYLAAAIQSLCPLAEFSFIEQDYSTVKWDVLEGKAPTKAEIDAEIAKIKADEIIEATTRATAKAEILNRLGITADEARLLLG